MSQKPINANNQPSPQYSAPVDSNLSKDLPSSHSSSAPESFFGGMNISPNQTETTHHTNEEQSNESLPISAFSFMSSSTSQSQSESPASEFSFMSSGNSYNQDSSVSSGSNNILESAQVSSFSFLSNNSSTSQTSHTDFEAAVSYSVPPPMAPIPVKLPVVPSEPSQEIKLARMASAKAVKKKKRATRVGFARDDEMDEGEENANIVPVAAPNSSTSTPTTPTSTMTSTSIATTEDESPLEQQHEQQQSRFIDPSPTPSSSHASPVFEIPEPPKGPLPPIPPKGPLPPVPNVNVDSFLPPQPQPSTVPTNHALTVIEVPVSVEQQTQEDTSVSVPSESLDDTDVMKYAEHTPDVSISGVEDEDMVEGDEEEEHKEHVIHEVSEVFSFLDRSEEEEEEDHETVHVDEAPFMQSNSKSNSIAAAAMDFFEGMSTAATVSVEAAVTAAAGGMDMFSDATMHVSVSADEEGKAVSCNERLKIQVEEVCGSLMQTSIKLSQLQESMCRQLRYVKAELDREEKETLEMKLKLSDLESEQQRLAQLEDFDKADALNDTIEMLRSRIASTKDRVGGRRDSIATLEAGLFENRQAQVMSLSRTADKFSDVAYQQRAEYQLVQSESQRRTALESVRLKSEEDRIGMEKKHIEREEEALCDESKLTEDAIKSQSGDILETKSILDAQLCSVVKEIQDLEQALAAKRNEEKRLKSDLISVEARIHDVRRKYDRQLIRINERKDSLARSKAECTEEEKLLVCEKKAFQDEVEFAHEMSEELFSGSQRLSQDISLIDMLKTSLTDLQKLSTPPSQPSSSSSSSPNASSSSYSSLLTAVASADAALASCVAAHDALLGEVGVLAAETRDIEERLPKLEVDKKAHAAAKRYKEASAVANSMKLLASKREEIESLVAEMTEDISTKAREIEALKARQVEAAAALLEAQREADIEDFNALVHKISILRSTSRKLSRHHSTFSSTTPAGMPVPTVTSSAFSPDKTAARRFGASASAGGAASNSNTKSSSVFESCKVYLEAEIQGLEGQALDIKAKHSGISLDFAAECDSDVEEDNDNNDHNNAYDEEDSTDLVAVYVDVTAVNSIHVLDGEEDCVEKEMEMDVQVASTSVDEDNINADADIDMPDIAELEVEEISAEDAEANSRAEAEARAAKTSEAQEILRVVNELNEQLQVASDEEDYDLAASLDEDIEVKRQRLQEILDELGCSESDLQYEVAGQNSSMDA